MKIRWYDMSFYGIFSQLDYFKIMSKFYEYDKIWIQ